MIDALRSADKATAVVLQEFVAFVHHAFGDATSYIGTTSAIDIPLSRTRDLDILVVLRQVNEAHVAYVWRIIRKLSGKYGTKLDTRIYSPDRLEAISPLNKSLLRDFLKDLFGSNPFSKFQIGVPELQSLCLKRIQDREEKIVALMPRTVADPAQVQAVAQAVYDAIRAYLIYTGKPCAQKRDAAEVLLDHLPHFEESKSIYEAHLDPQSVTDVAGFLVDCLALVKHLRYRAQAHQLTDKVLLINTPSAALPHPQDNYLSYDHNMPLGIICLASYLRERGQPVQVLDAYAENLGALATIDRLFAEHELPRIIGFNACSPNIHVVHQIARYIKRVRKDIVVVCGGPHASLAPEHTLSTGDVDFVVVGEGEECLVNLVTLLFSSSATAPVDIPGVLRLEDDRVVGTKEHPVLDMNDLPTPQFGLLPIDRYFATKRRVYMHTTRGCAFRCIYCSVPECWGRDVRTMSVDRLIGQLEQTLEKYAPEELQIVDDNFSHQRGRLIKTFCDAIIAKTVKIRWKCQVRADQIPDELPEIMSRAGCFEADLGIESGDPDVQKYIRKNLNLARTREVVKLFADAGVYVKAFFMLGFPRESFDDLRSTINYSVALREVGLGDVAFFPVMPFPGTEIATEAGQTVHQGAVIDDIGDRGHSYAAHRLRKYSAKPEVSLNSQFDPESLRLLVKFAYQRFQLRAPVDDLAKEFAHFQKLEDEERYAL